MFMHNIIIFDIYYCVEGSYYNNAITALVLLLLLSLSLQLRNHIDDPCTYIFGIGYNIRIYELTIDVQLTLEQE